VNGKLGTPATLIGHEKDPDGISWDTICG